MYITYGIDWQHVAKDGSILGYPVVSKPAGNYVDNVSLTVAPSKGGTTLVYTTDGSEPTAASATISATTPLTFTESTPLKVGVLNGDQVENVEFGPGPLRAASQAPTGLAKPSPAWTR